MLSSVDQAGQVLRPVPDVRPWIRVILLLRQPWSFAGKASLVGGTANGLFAELAFHWPELDGFDQHFQATGCFPLTSAVDKPQQHQ